MMKSAAQIGRNVHGTGDVRPYPYRQLPL